MQLREGQSCIPFSKRRADKRVRKGQTAGVSPGTLLWVIWGAQGAGKGSVSPAMFITQCCWAQEMRALLVSWIALKKHWPFHLWGYFFTRYASVLQTFSTLTAALIHTFATGLLCRAWAPGIPSCHIPREHEQSFCLCAECCGFGLSLTWLHTCHALSWEGAHVVNLWVWRAEVFTQQPAHPEQACLEEWGTNVWAKGGLDLKAQTDRAAETDRSWKQTHRSTSACLCSAKRHLQSLDHDGCNLLCWNFSIHRLTVQCRRIIYLMCTYLLQCPSSHLPFPSSLHSMNLFMVFSTKAKSLMTSKMQYFQLKHFC